MNELEISALYKSYADQSVLRDLDLSIEPGSFTSILGPSGSGKTTLLRVIAGFDRADSGTVHLRGEVADDGTRFVPSDRRRIGYVPQDGSLFPHLSVIQNVSFGLARRERRSARVLELLDMVGLRGFASRFPHQLSGGQQQRVALARALAIDPAIVLLDEPFSSLDASLRASVRQDVRKVLRERGTTALLVTHDQDEALSLADRVAIMSDGRIGQYDTPAGLYAHPLSPDLALGLGEANFVQGIARGDHVETTLGALRLEPIDGKDANEKAGTQLIVLVRPEQIQVLRDPTGDSARAEVVETEFYGHDAVVRLRGLWGDSMVIVARTTDATTLPVSGTRVGLSVRGTVVAWNRSAVESTG